MSGDSADALSAALLSAIKRAVEEGQSAGLELLATLDVALTDKVRVHYYDKNWNMLTFIDPPTR